MLRALLRRQLDSAEQKLGAPVDYLRFVAEHDPVAAVKFGLLQPATAHRKTLPAEVYHAARIAATQTADCGTCVQIEVNAAREAGVSAEAVRAVLAGTASGEAVQDAIAFARQTARHEDPGEDLRERIVARYGERGLVEVSLAVTTALAYPTMKRALGFATACSLVEVEV
ncbi:MAG: carboxymuconolactone decarboxylase family protein [Bacteroidota bacterium]